MERNCQHGIVVGLELSDLAHSARGLGIPGRGVPASREASSLRSRGKQLSGPLPKSGDFLGKQTVGKQNKAKQTNDKQTKRDVWSKTQVRPETNPHSAWFHNPPIEAGGVISAIWVIACPTFDRGHPRSIAAFERRAFLVQQGLTPCFTGVETRTSSPVRIPAGRNLESLGIPWGLLPAGEELAMPAGILSARSTGSTVWQKLCAHSSSLQRQRDQANLLATLVYFKSSPGFEIQQAGGRPCLPPIALN